MKIVLIGASGFVGSFILSEALNRGHQVTAIVRNPGKLDQHSNLTSIQADVFDQDLLVELIAHHDAVISAFSASQLQVQGFQSIIKATKRAKVQRLLVVGGAGSLKTSSGIDLVDTPEFPKEWKQLALATREVLKILKSESRLDWIFLSPSAQLFPGERTLKFRLGKDQLLIDEKGESSISTEDYAVAMLDELESPKHIRQRFTVGY
ncbi:MAG: NAD(P)-dependent oxidoreductase [Legionella sp.]|jgi:hypothetical protein